MPSVSAFTLPRRSLRDEATARSPRARCTRAGVLAILSLLLLAPAPAAWAITAEDHEFLDFLINEVKYYDTALRYLDGLEKEGRQDTNSQAETASRRIDVLQAQGRTADAEKAVQDFQKRFPNHPRASIGNLEKIGQKAQAVLESLVKAQRMQDSTKADALRAEAVTTFNDQVVKPLASLIQSLQAKVDAARKQNKPPPRGTGAAREPSQRPADTEALMNLLRPLEYAELQRLKFYQSFATALPEGAAARKEALEKGRSLAQEFVDKRFDFPLMQFQAQLHVGQFEFEMQHYDAAEEALSVLYGIVPPFPGPYKDDVIEPFRNLRLQAIFYGARARNAARAYPKAVQLIEQHFIRSAPGPFDLSKAEEDAGTRANAASVRLEYGIALAGAGDPTRGLGEIHKIIDKPNQPASIVLDARKALGRIAAQGGAGLGARDLYEASIGLKSDYQLEEALDCMQWGLSRLNPSKSQEYAEVAPLCLNEIAELNFLLGRYVESALAYNEIFSFHSSAAKELLGKVSRNFLASTNRAIKVTQGGAAHTGLRELKEAATRASEQFAGGFTVFEAMIYDGKALETAGKLDEARKKYLEVKPDLKGVKVPVYFRAQAYAWRCLYRLWDQSDAEHRKALDPELEKAVATLPQVASRALQERDLEAASLASLTLGQIQFQRGQFRESAAALKGFADELTAEETNRCPGLASLIIAEAKAEDLPASEGHFKKMQEVCGESPLVAISASAIADAFETQKKHEDAARYTLIYAKHPASKDDLEKPAELARVAGILIEGGKADDAAPYIKKLNEANKDASPETARAVIILEAKVYQHEKQWDKAIAKLKSYVEKFKPQDDQAYEDAYVLKDLGDAYLVRTKGKPTLKDMKSAEEAYNTACYVMRRRISRNPDAERIFWQWTLDFMKLQMRIGDAGQVNAYRTLSDFVEREKTTEMGGLKAEFVALAQQAADKLEKRKEPAKQ